MFFFISRKVRRDELAEEKRFSDAEKENREDREAAATPTREEPTVKEEEIGFRRRRGESTRAGGGASVRRVGCGNGLQRKRRVGKRGSSRRRQRLP